MDNSLNDIKHCIDKNQSFILEAGAGSGKTWALVESLKYIIENKGDYLAKNNKQIACITYTNVAANEICERIDNNPLVYVGTIHNFLWSIISNYSEELKLEIIKHNDNQDVTKQIPDLVNALKKIKKIDYNQYKRDYALGQLWHDDIIIFSKYLFDKSKKLALFTLNQFPYIFVDEYQDTFPKVVDILLQDIYQHFSNKVVIGFFGDSMQKIYDKGVGRIELGDYPNIKEITKLDNFRCSKEVIHLLNKIRPNLIQNPSGHNVDGKISFYYCTENYPTEDILMSELIKQGWIFNGNKSKVLYLTHRKIAAHGGYENLLNAFPDRERFFAREYIFSRLIFEIEDICRSYYNNDYKNLFDRLNANGFKIKRQTDKKDIRVYIETLNIYRSNNTIKETLDFIITNPVQIFQIQDYTNFLSHIDDEDMVSKKEIYYAIKDISFKEVTNCFDYIESNTIFSTKHGVKGAEFDNVLVILDDKAWNKFSDNEVFSKNDSNKNRYDRSKNLLYVCCSRAKQRLALYATTPMSSTAQATILEWFGKENVYS